MLKQQKLKTVLQKLKKLKHPVRVLLFGCCFIFVFVFSIHWLLTRVSASEQIGSSPTSGADSRLKTASVAVAALGYGSTAAGSWGDWGAMWNRIYSAAQGSFNDAKVAGLKNGSGTGTIAGYTKALGGVDDYNNNQTIPADTYQKTWTACNVGNSYCGSGASNAEKQDPNTGLIWSGQTAASANWFTANNCVQPSNGVAPLGASACTSNGDVGCVCVKLTSSKTGCELLGDGNWRLPYQKELMQSYIDGSWGNLTSAATNYWSSSTLSSYTPNAWFTGQHYGGTGNNTKPSTASVRCVR